MKLGSTGSTLRVAGRWTVVSSLVERAVILTMLFVMGSCSTATYRVERAHIDCEDANEQVYRVLTNLDYSISRFDPAARDTVGEVEASRPTPDGPRYGKVRITCANTTVFQPVEGAWFLPKFDFSRDVYYGLMAYLDSRQTSTTAASGSGAYASPAASPVAPARSKGSLRIIMRPVDRFEMRKATGVDLDRRGLLVVRVAITNRTRRSYALHADRIVLVRTDGKRLGPLGSAAIEKLLRTTAAATPAPEERPLPVIDILATVRTLEKAELASGRVRPGKSRGGFLYFPEGRYRSGRIRLIDVETGEAEGTVVAF